MSKIHNKLRLIQAALKAPKSQYNSFAKFNYRNLEDILEAVKPLLNDHGLTLTISDEPVAVGNRVYIMSTATLTCVETGEQVINQAVAREADERKGMDASQISGATSSYSRKYNCNGLFCIDDSRDADSKDNSEAPDSANTAALVHAATDALDKQDWATLCQLDRENGEEWLAGWKQLASHKRSAMKKLMDKANEYRDLIQGYDQTEDDDGILQLWEELTKEGKTEVWRRLNETSKSRITALRKA